MTGKQKPTEDHRRGYRVKEIDKDTEAVKRITAKKTTLKKAFYQRMILNTIEQVRHVLQNHDITKIYRQIHNPVLEDVKASDVHKLPQKLQADIYVVSDDEHEKAPDTDVEDDKSEAEEKPKSVPAGASASSSGSTARVEPKTRIDPQPDPIKERDRDKERPPRKDLKDIPRAGPLLPVQQDSKGRTIKPAEPPRPPATYPPLTEKEKKRRIGLLKTMHLNEPTEARVMELEDLDRRYVMHHQRFDVKPLSAQEYQTMRDLEKKRGLTNAEEKKLQQLAIRYRAHSKK
jgi:hypothetical protein